MRMYKLAINNTKYNVVIKEVTPDEVTAEVNGEVHTVRIRDIEDLSKPAPLAPVARAEGSPHSSHQMAPSAISKPVSSSGSLGALIAPIPGQIISVNVSVGEKVLKGQKVLILEAMKLENVITANCDGVVAKILVKEGDTVDQNQDLLVIK